jgi:hypothetical protein
MWQLGVEWDNRAPLYHVFDLVLSELWISSLNTTRSDVIMKIGRFTIIVVDHHWQKEMSVTMIGFIRRTFLLDFAQWGRKRIQNYSFTN